MYGATIAFGLLVALLLAEQILLSSKKFRKKDKEILWEGFFIIVIAGVIGARIYHVVDYWEYYKTFPSQIIMIWNGGLGIFGAIIAALSASYVYLNRKKQEITKWLDLVGIVTPLGQAIGRWANVFNLELLPYAIYESAFNLLLFLLLYLLYQEGPKLKNGMFMWLYLIGYGTIRVLVEPTKQQRWEINGYNVAQSFGVIIIVLGLLGIYKTYGKNLKKKS